LASRDLLLAHNVDFVAPDQHRYDGRLDALSLSIHSVNKAILLKKMAECGGDWPILKIDASVLWTHACRFCWTNAASSKILNHRGRIDGKWAFNYMFEDRPISLIDTRSQRETYGRLPNQPTDIQAEVQVLGHIHPDLVFDFTVKDERVKRRLEIVMNRIGEHRPIVVCEDAFR
jgi:hypothetical protein